MSTKKVLTLNDILLDKKVYIEPIATLSYNSVYHNLEHDKYMMTGTTRSIVPATDSNLNFIPVLTREETTVIEEATGLNLDNSVHPEKSFWNSAKARIAFNKDAKSLSSAAVVLDLNNVIDYLKYKYCLKHPKVAPSWGKRHNKDYEYVLKDLNAEFAEELDKNKKEAAVLEYIITNKSSQKKLKNLLGLFSGTTSNIGQRAKSDSTTDWLFNTLFNLTKDNRNIEQLYNIVSLPETNLTAKIFVDDAIDAGAIKIKGSKYEIIGVETPFYTIDDIVTFLKDKKNSEIKLRITKEIKSE